MTPTEFSQPRGIDMTELNQIKTDSVVRTQLVPLSDMQMVLPNTCIAEVIPYQQPEPVDNVPDWLLGMINWRGVVIPVISFEAVNGLEFHSDPKQNRIAVLNGIGGNTDLPFYGLVVQGIPRLLTLDRSSISAISKPDTKLPMSLEQTQIGEETAVIPDQDKI
jgi:chemosensory pili system protein ChpC